MKRTGRSQKGWHDRARTHFDAYAASQVTDVPNTIPHPAQDSTMNLARSEKRWGCLLYTSTAVSLPILENIIIQVYLI